MENTNQFILRIEADSLQEERPKLTEQGLKMPNFTSNFQYDNQRTSSGSA